MEQRKIKFRAYIHELNLMIDDVDVYSSGMIGIDTHDLKLPENYYLDFDDSCIRKVNHDENGIDYMIMSFLQGEDYIWFEKGFELMQFTGLTDKRGTRIFECDVVKMYVTEKEDTYFGTGKVIFHMGCFMVEWIDDKEAMMDLLSMTKTGRPYFQETIGDIFQNPELLH